MIGENVTKFRKSLSISQRELGRRVGISGQMVSKIENNLTNPSLETLNKIAETLNVSVYDLMYDVEKIQKEVNFIEKTEKLLNLLGYEIRSIASCVETQEVAENIPVYEVYSNGGLVSKLTNSQFMKLIDNVKLIVDYELTKNNSK